MAQTRAWTSFRQFGARLMHICHVVRQYYPSTGGLENFVATLARHLTELGSVNAVITLDRLFSNPSEDLERREIIDDVLVRRVPFFGHRRMFAPLIPQEMLRRFDVIHVHGIDGMFERVARQRRQDGQIRIATSHGAFFHTPFLHSVKKAYFASITKIAAQSYDGLIANSAQDAGLLRDLRRDLITIPNGIEPLGAFMAQGKDLLYLGRLSSNKHIERLITTLAQPALDGVRLHVVGPDWDVTGAALQTQAAGLGVSDRLIIHGRLDQDALAAVARQCGVFVSASLYEGFGMSLIEAMSIGLMPVVQPNASFVELIGEAKLGALAPFEQPAVAARAIADQLSGANPALRAAAMAYARRFSWRTHARQTFKYYEERRAAQTEPRGALAATA
jgi:alpha-1,3-mannosyltransferase